MANPSQDETEGWTNGARRHARSHVVLQTTALLTLFFMIALASRIPALRFDNVYGLHALLVALPYSFVTSVYTHCSHRIAPAVGALSLLGALLGTISPTMALACLAPAAAGGLAWALLHGSPFRAIITSACIGAAGYPATIIGGLVSGSLAIGNKEGFVGIALLAMLSCALALMGSLIADKLRSDEQRKAH